MTLDRKSIIFWISKVSHIFFQMQFAVLELVFLIPFVVVVVDVVVVCLFCCYFVCLLLWLSNQSICI